ncbi:Fe-S cluster assembly protein SufD [Alsobacter metallidurans]|uniref:Fe-S cluster assembly protein SufD n=1 Tax=Alsobacter metallidurans TaxID=340221 RepID=A0A917I7I6_9HYPH|nr:Fe-S cluster assembly protein SufD [Alsobacter metallidurans]GGH22307.1 Fe-S cluster assembly protein SufD [Alsobacter metallidurans]
MADLTPNVTPMRTAAENQLLALFPSVKARLPGASAERQQAYDAFAQAGLPHRRVEAWKYTDLRAVLREAAPLADVPSAALLGEVRAKPSPFAGLGPSLVIVDGVFEPSLSDLDALPAGVEALGLAGALGAAQPVANLGEAAVADDAVLALNAAFMTDGVVLRVAAGSKVETPVFVRFVRTGGEPRSTYTRVLVVVGEGASLTLGESREGPAGVAHQDNAVLEIVAGDRATVSHVVLNTEGRGSIDLSTVGVKLGAKCLFNTFALATAPALSRRQIFVHFAGENSKISLNGGALLNGRQHADTTLVVNHAVPHCESRELYKHVLDGESTGVFQGKIIVQPYAQKTDGQMMSQAVLLGDNATMNNKPELEIFADDVVCAHGATCGQLDDDLLFYLRARGLPKPDAEALMLQAFVGQALETIEDESIRGVLESVVEGWLKARM